MTLSSDTNQLVDQSKSNDRADEIRAKMAALRQSISTGDVLKAAAEFPECGDALERLHSRLAQLEDGLKEIPPIDVAVLGPSRHGKSTLLNALAACDLLPTLDTKPCTASILRMTWAPEWSVIVKFVGKDQLVNDWKAAVRDASDELEHQQMQSGSNPNEDPLFVRNVLQRFIQLFRVDTNLPPSELLQQVKSATIPAETARLLGQDARANATDVDGMRKVIAKYLSTSDVYWTLVESCEIFGPFQDWHPSLSLVDLPGTNDTDPQRSLITNSVRESATAVAIVTSDSNLGPDIEAWLRHSAVLTNFLEATRKRRQRLFIIRTKLDSYHPQIDESDLGDLSEEEEIQLHFDAVERYKQEQTATFRSMLRDIAEPRLPREEDPESIEQRSELLSRVDELPVFYVSALAHEVFAGRFRTPRKNKRQLSDYFDDDISKTGVSELRSFLVDVASQYLSENFYDDLEHQLDSEARLLAGVFRTSATSVKAEVAGGKKALGELITTVRTDVVPWLSTEVTAIGNAFRENATSGSQGIEQRLRQARNLSSRRMNDKLKLWTNYHWASLRAAARKHGSHITGRGQSINFAEDVVSVLVDDILLAWTSFRDDLISSQIDQMTSELAQQLNNRLCELKMLSDVTEVQDAISSISEQLYGITHQQRLELLAFVNEQIKRVESLRKPAYEVAQSEFSPMYLKISTEFGGGCSYRMRDHLEAMAPKAIEQIIRRVNDLILGAVTELTDECTTAIRSFGQVAEDRIETTVTRVSERLAKQDQAMLESKLAMADRAVAALPG